MHAGRHAQLQAVRHGIQPGGSRRYICFVQCTQGEGSIVTAFADLRRQFFGRSVEARLGVKLQNVVTHAQAGNIGSAARFDLS